VTWDKNMHIVENIIIDSLIILIYIIVVRLWVEIIISYNQNTIDRSKFFFYYLYKITEPFAIPFRRILPAGVMDISPIFAIAALDMIRILLSRIFFQLDVILQIN
jgi:uncharacterized protein YggT (Ycf19 family)